MGFVVSLMLRRQLSIEANGCAREIPLISTSNLLLAGDNRAVFYNTLVSDVGYNQWRCLEVSGHKHQQNFTVSQAGKSCLTVTGLLLQT